MDPISAIFGSYLDAVSSSVTQHTADVIGAVIQTLLVEQKGMRVP